jgi:hypothetical protein
MRLGSAFCAVLIALGGGSPAMAMVADQSARAAHEGCQLQAADRRWLNESVAAWNFALEHVAKARVQKLRVLIFDRRCTVTSGTAMTGGAATWSGVAHNGSVLLPDGQSIPAQVTSFSAPAGDGAFFVMAAPSIWKEAGVAGGELGLETLMTGVLLHEGSHVLQFPTFGEELAKLTRRYGLPESFNDDSIQKQFEMDQAFAASAARETELLFSAAATSDVQQGRRLAREALAMIGARRDRWFRGKDAYLSEAEDIWLTMEGSGQWLAYRWLTDLRGGATSETAAMPGFAQRGRWWSQKQGIALFLALERLGGSEWKPRVFGGGSPKATQLLELALAAAE